MKKDKKKDRNTKKLFITIVIICSVGIVSFVFAPSRQPIPHRNPIDTKISQYSDKHITPNAVIVNPEFKNVAFETSAVKSSPFSSQIAAVIRSLKSFAKSSPAEPREYGTWVWTPIFDMTASYIDSIIADAKANGVNTIYVSVDSYLDIFVMEKGADKEMRKKLFSDKLEYFISQAGKKGIVVDAEAGWRNWAEDENIYKAFAIVNFVKKFNATHQNKFRGFQYDVEPYLLDSYKKNPTSVLKNFLSLVEKTEIFMGEDSLKFSVVIPDFYDGKDRMTPKFSYNGKKDYAFKHLLNILDRRKGSSIIVMSYRSFAAGFDGSIEISQNEMQTAKGHETRVIIAQETGDVPPPYITFHNTSKRHFKNQIKSINTAFDPNPNFGGIAIHYANAFLALK